jgi:hypothetical protein
MIRNSIRRPKDDEAAKPANAAPQAAATPAGANNNSKPGKTPPQAVANQAAPNAPAAVANRTATSPTTPVAGNPPSASPQVAAAPLPEPIVPPQPATAEARFQRTVQSLQEIGAALEAYAQQNRRYPNPAIRDAAGQPLLSWRVELLPYLGYAALYQQFALDQPWDSPQNQALLKHIPVQYRAAHRWDERTNVLLPVGNSTAFRPAGAVNVRKFDDGISNTVIAVEADDAIAVAWTQPQDLAFEPTRPQQNLGGLHSGSFLAVWGGGKILETSATLPANQLKGIFTVDGGETINVAQIAKDPNMASSQSAIPIAATGTTATLPPSSTDTALVTTANPFVAGSAATRDDSAAAAGTSSGRSGRFTNATQPTKLAQRFPVPSHDAQVEARKTLQDLYGPSIKDAKTSSERLKIAQEMLKDTQQFEAGSARVYVAMNVAMEIGVKESDTAIAIKAWQELTDAFEFPIRERRLALIEKLIQSRLTSSQLQMLKPLLSDAVDEAIATDDYTSALSVIAMAYRVSKARNNQALSEYLRDQQEMLERLRTEFIRYTKLLSAETLTDNDRQSNYIAGRYLCFIKGDWPSGLPLLAKGDDPKIAELAAADLLPPTDIESKVAVAHQWWELGQQEESIVRRRMLSHALELYRLVRDELPQGLVRTQVEYRIRQLETELKPRR